MTDADRERILDRRILARLRTDPAYLHAESAEAQSEREDQIADEETTMLEAESIRGSLAEQLGAGRV